MLQERQTFQSIEHTIRLTSETESPIPTTINIMENPQLAAELAAFGDTDGVRFSLREEEIDIEGAITIQAHLDLTIPGIPSHIAFEQYNRYLLGKGITTVTRDLHDRRIEEVFDYYDNKYQELNPEWQPKLDPSISPRR